MSTAAKLRASPVAVIFQFGSQLVRKTAWCLYLCFQKHLTDISLPLAITS